MNILRASFLLLAISGFTTIGCGEPAAKAPANPAPAATEEKPAAGSDAKAAPAAEATGTEAAGSDKKEG